MSDHQVQQSLVSALEAKNFESTCLLYRNDRSQIDTKNQEGLTCVELAVKMGDLKLLQAVFRCQPEKLRDTKSCLLFASSGDSLPVFKYLLEKFPEQLSVSTPEGVSPVEVLIMLEKTVELFFLLYRHPEELDREGKTNPFFEACRTGNLKIAQLIYTSNLKKKPLLEVFPEGTGAHVCPLTVPWINFFKEFAPQVFTKRDSRGNLPHYKIILFDDEARLSHLLKQFPELFTAELVTLVKKKGAVSCFDMLKTLSQTKFTKQSALAFLEAGFFGDVCEDRSFGDKFLLEKWTGKEVISWIKSRKILDVLKYLSAFKLVPVERKNVFVYACEHGDLEMIKESSFLGDDDPKIFGEVPPLFLLCSRLDTPWETVKFVADSGRHLSTTYKGKTVGYLACETGNLNLLKLFHSKFPEKLLVPFEDMTPLQACIVYGHKSCELFLTANLPAKKIKCPSCRAEGLTQKLFTNLIKPDQECPICLTEFEEKEIFVTACGHILCGYCLNML